MGCSLDSGAIVHSGVGEAEGLEGRGAERVRRRQEETELSPVRFGLGTSAQPLGLIRLRMKSRGRGWGEGDRFISLKEGEGPRICAELKTWPLCL